MQTHSIYTFLARNFTGQLDGITSRYSTGFVAGLNLLSDKWLCRCNEDDLAGWKPTINWEEKG